MEIKPTLGTVQETLLLPLIGRAEFSRLNWHDFKDDKAEWLLEKLDFNKAKARRNMGQAGMLAMAVRAQKMDNAIREFVYDHPKATVLNIGAGLDTAFWRVDNGLIRWIDLDLPDSIELRLQLLPEGRRNKCMARSMFDYEWIDEIGDVSDGLFIQVPGVIPYIPKAQVREFFEQVPGRLPGAEIIFDVISDLSRKMVNSAVNRAGMSRTRMDWGVSDANVIAAWSPHIEVVRQEPYFKDIPRNWRYWPHTNALMSINDIASVAQFFHLRFI